MIDEKEMLRKLDGVEVGTTVFVSYRAGREPKPRALREAMKAEREGYPKRWFIGRLTEKRVTKKGESVFTVFSTTRYNEDAPSAEGHYRTFNPSLGTLLALEVIS